MTTLPATIPGLIVPGSRVTTTWSVDDGPEYEVFGFVRRILPDDRVLWWSEDPYIGHDNRALVFLRLDLSDPASRDRVVRWARDGERCAANRGEECPACFRSGAACRPWDLRDFSDLAGKLTAEQSAAALAHCARSIAAGGEPLCGVLGEWSIGAMAASGEESWREVLVGGVNTYARVTARGWSVYDRATVAAAHGRETGAAGREAADRAALAARYALLDEAGGVTLPALPEGA